MIFKVYLEAKPEDLLKEVQKYNITFYPFIDKDNPFLYGFLISKPTKDYPYGIDAKAVIIDNTDINGITSIEFWNIDY